ncbi:hypothetical protein F4680DRAFT_466427 [Xylaria scruposa]|nr:hypothetical protein F4680DRAFT_466427 [Xylaria scruposa]
MAPNQQTKKTFTVPVGTRLSYGIELEMLVAYLDTSDVDPDGTNSENLAPVLRIDTSGEGNDITRDVGHQKPSGKIVEEHIRRTLRNHGIGVNKPEADPFSKDIPPHLQGLDRWDVTSDLSVRGENQESELAKGKPGKYKWLGLELRSPACWDEPRAYEEIRFVVNLMKLKYRVRINITCGFHVHVANGPRFFDAKTLKRAGAFFFAADPILSRLHAPWRRAGVFTPSIRYVSRLAHLDETRPLDTQMPTEHAAALFRGHPFAYPNREYLPVVPWSDRSREEKDFGGKLKGGMANWERYANERVQKGPHIILSEKPRTPESSTASEDLISHPPSLSSSSPPSGNDDDEGGSSHHRRFLRLMATPEFRATCLREFGHGHPESLHPDDQFAVLGIYQCERLFGHSSPNLLSDSQYHDLTVACAPYNEIGWNSWEWDARTNKFTMKDGSIGAVLRQPRPKLLRQTHGEKVVLKLDALAAVQEAEGERRVLEKGIKDDTRAFNNDGEIEKIVADKNLWRGIYYNTIDRLMTQPTFPLENTESLLAQFPLESTAGSRSNSWSTTDTSGSFNPPALKALAMASPGSNGNPKSTADTSDGSNEPTGKATSTRVFRVPGTPSSDSSARVFQVPGTPSSDSSSSANASRAANNGGNEFGFLFSKAATGGAFDSLPGTPSSSNSHSNSGSGFNPPAFSAYRASSSHEIDDHKNDDHENDEHETSDKHSPTSSPFLSNVSPTNRNSRIISGHKLRPHDIYQLSDSYIHGISHVYDFDGARWRRISWLPYPGGSPDPQENHQRGGIACRPGCTQHVLTDTRAGVATVLGVDSGAAVAQLFRATTTGDRANYNFQAYELDRLDLSGWARTIEFREAGGSLDPDWIVTWVKICVGMMRFCRDASVIDFITVLERVVREEERQRTSDSERDDKDIYDVCDLLEDICLFAEAATVRERERKFGPPR